MVYPVVKAILFPIFRIWIKEVNGVKNIPAKGPFIIAANHSSYIDPLIVGTVFISKTDQKIHFITKVGALWCICLEELSVRWAGCIPTSETRLMKKKPLQGAIEFLKQGKIIGIFPEGTRNYGELIRAHTGVARMACEGFPVIPVGIIGTHEIYPRGKTFPRMRKKVIVNIGNPMKFKKVPESRISKALLEKITRKIMRGIGNLSNLEYKW